MKKGVVIGLIIFIVLAILFWMIPTEPSQTAKNASKQAQGMYETKPKIKNICEELTSDSLKDSCLQNAAINTSNEALCDGISDKWTRLMCKAKITLNPEFCKMMNPVENKACYTAIAEKTKDDKFCDGIDDFYLNVFCHTSIRKDTVYCEKIDKRVKSDDIRMYDLCIIESIIARNADVSECSSFEDKTYKRCIQELELTK